MGYIRWCILILILFFPLFIYAEQMDLLSYLDEIDAQLLWNPVSGTGVILRGGNSVVFKVGAEWYIGDYTEKFRADPVIRRNHTLYLTQKTVSLITEYFVASRKFWVAHLVLKYHMVISISVRIESRYPTK